MRIIEALVLLSLGLFLGVTSTILDVFIVGGASFVMHFAFWVLLCTVLGTLVGNKGKAVWWSFPLCLGYVESYFITTVATYESYVKSSVVPLFVMALLAPLLTYAIWYAKGQRSIFGYLLRILVVAGTLGCDYLINGSISVYTIVICVIIALLLLIPFRRFQFTKVVVAEETSRKPERGESGSKGRGRKEGNAASRGRSGSSGRSSRKRQASKARA